MIIPADGEFTGALDRHGVEINVGDQLKWIRDAEFYKSGAKKGQEKLAAAEFVAGIVVKTDNPDYPYWCHDGTVKKGKADDGEDDFFPIPPGLNFLSMLQYIEVIPK